MLQPDNASQKLNPCELCHGTDFTLIADKDRDHHPLPTVVCHGCGLVFTNPRPSDTELEDFYRESYRIEYKQSAQPQLKHVYRAGLVALERLDYLLPLLETSHRLLDLGSGGGELLYILRGLGFSVEGIEPNIGYGSVARDSYGLPIQITHYREAKVEPRSLNIVTAFHVLEHLPHPVEALATLGSWIQDDGLMLIEVPHVFSRCQWPQSRYHKGHLYHFSSSTLAKVGQKAGLVLTDSFTSHDGGNLMAVFRKPAHPTPTMTGVIPGHAQRVLKHLRDHTALSHAVTHRPYTRPFQKLAQRLRERLELQRQDDPHAMLDHFVHRARRVQTGRTSTPITKAIPYSCSLSQL